jgi:hypothetical protein
VYFSFSVADETEEEKETSVSETMNYQKKKSKIKQAIDTNLNNNI